MQTAWCDFQSAGRQLLRPHVSSINAAERHTDGRVTRCVCWSSSCCWLLGHAKPRKYTMNSANHSSMCGHTLETWLHCIPCSPCVDQPKKDGCSAKSFCRHLGHTQIHKLSLELLLGHKINQHSCSNGIPAADDQERRGQWQVH